MVINKYELQMFFEDFTSSHLASMAPEHAIAVVDPNKPDEEDEDVDNDR